jgi:hypothetical protein
MKMVRILQSVTVGMEILALFLNRTEVGHPLICDLGKRKYRSLHTNAVLHDTTGSVIVNESSLLATIIVRVGTGGQFDITDDR